MQSLQLSQASLTTYMTATVYVIAHPALRADGFMPNLTGLNRYGRVQTLLEPGEDPARDPALCLRNMRERLRHFNPERDFLVWSGGDTLAAVLCGVALADEGHVFVRWLRVDQEWRRKSLAAQKSARRNPDREGDPGFEDLMESKYNEQYVPLPESSHTDDDLEDDDATAQELTRPVRTTPKFSREPGPVGGRRSRED